MNASPAVASKVTPPLGYGDYLRFARLVHERFGLYFPEKRRAELEQGVRRAFAASTCSELDEYFQLLQDSTKGALHLEQLVNALTVCETHFFRDAAQIDALYNHVLPEIIRRRRSLRTLRVWSAGCASGEEPYTIAMLLRELLPDLEQWSITILGTDVNTEAIDRAQKGLYSEWAFREERAKQWRPRYFRQIGKHYELNPDIRRLVTFAPLNLVEDNYPSYESNTRYMDLILCRNVTIYFTEAVTRRVIERYYEALVDNGWLVVGHSEHSLGTYQRFQVRNFPGAIFYQRTGQPTLMPQDWDWLTAMAEEDKSRPAAPALPTVTPTTTRPATAPFAPATSAPAATRPQTGPFQRRELPDDGDPLEYAGELLVLGRSEEARDLLLKVFGANSTNSRACILLGQAQANLGNWRDAEQWCRKAIHMDKLALPAYYTLSLVLQHQGQIDPAIEAMKKVVYIDRLHVLGHYGLADLYHSNGQLPQALKSLDNARRLLESRPASDVIPDSGGITVTRLREAIVRQQQQWSEHT